MKVTIMFMIVANKIMKMTIMTMKITAMVMEMANKNLIVAFKIMKMAFKVIKMTIMTTKMTAKVTNPGKICPRQGFAHLPSNGGLATIAIPKPALIDSGMP